MDEMVIKLMPLSLRLLRLLRNKNNDKYMIMYLLLYLALTLSGGKALFNMVNKKLLYICSPSVHYLFVFIKP